VPSASDGPGSCQRLTPNLLSRQNLDAAGVFKNGARQPFLLSESRCPGKKLSAAVPIAVFNFVIPLFSKTNPPMKYPG
jgi:hypothetical protein